MATVRDGIYLEQNSPARDQFSVGRRDPVRSVIVVHTAEGGTDTIGSDPTAENVAQFIRRRDTAGSYHLLGDADSIIQLVRFENEAYHDRTGSNRWSIGISLSLNAADWGRLSTSRRNQFVETAAQMAVIAARWLENRGLEVPAARKLTFNESEREDASGFVSHATRDPSRRTDPGAGFPWDDFFRQYQQQLSGVGIRPSRTALTRELQAVVGVRADGAIGPITMAALNRNWLGRDETFDSSVADSFTNNPRVIQWVQARLNGRPGVSLTVDGGYGPVTEAAVKRVLGRSGVVAAESFIVLLDDAQLDWALPEGSG